MLPPRETGYYGGWTGTSYDRYESFGDPVIIGQLITYSFCLVILVAVLLLWLRFRVRSYERRHGVVKGLPWFAFAPAILLGIVTNVIQVNSTTFDASSGLSPSKADAFLTAATYTGEISNLNILIIVLHPFNSLLSGQRALRTRKLLPKVAVGIIALLLVPLLILCAIYYVSEMDSVPYGAVALYSSIYFTFFFLALLLGAAVSLTLAFRRYGGHALSRKAKFWTVVTFAGLLSSAFMVALDSWGWGVGPLVHDSGGRSVFLVLSRLPSALGVLALLLAAREIGDRGAAEHRAVRDDNTLHGTTSNDVVSTAKFEVGEKPAKVSHSTEHSAYSQA